MVRTDIRPMKLEDIYLKITDHTQYGISDSFEIASAFQRGSEADGVWKRENKKNYINSLKSHYPTGIITLVKEHTSAGPWKVLDGGNRLRTIRDFRLGVFGIDLDGEGALNLFDNFSERDKADFNTLLIPCQFLTIEQNDPDHTIADMYCSLNTSAESLRNGELYKAHGWKSDNWAIEVSKKMIGDSWDSVLSDARIDILRVRWISTFGNLSEAKRCESLAMMIGYIVSAATSKFVNFESIYKVNKKILSTLAHEPSEDMKNAIFKKLSDFINIMSRIDRSNGLFGRASRGILPKLKVTPVWQPICENKMTDELGESMIRFYNVHANNNPEVCAEYTYLLSTGDNHATSAKSNAVHEYIKSFE